MKAYCITLRGHEYSERVGARCIQSATEVGKIRVEKFDAVNRHEARAVMESRGLIWTWGKGCSVTRLKHHDYGGDLDARIGCAMSHYLLWERCVELWEPILILEHDAVFLREMPQFDFTTVCQINDPNGATRRGKWWSDYMVRRATVGVHAKTLVASDPRVPDGLAGNSAYVIRPLAAYQMMGLCKNLGLWPNDAIMCQQLMHLEEYFPFITKVEQERSTSGGA